MSSYSYGLEALRRYREERAKNPPPKDQPVPPEEEQAEGEGAGLALDEDDDVEDEFEDLFERWMDCNIESPFRFSDLEEGSGGPDAPVAHE